MKRNIAPTYCQMSTFLGAQVKMIHFFFFYSWFLKFDILNLMWLESSLLIHWRKTSLSISFMNHADSMVVARTSFHWTLFSLANMQMGILSHHCTQLATTNGHSECVEGSSLDSSCMTTLRSILWTMDKAIFVDF